MTEEIAGGQVGSGAQPAQRRGWRRAAKPVAGTAVLVAVVAWSVGAFRSRTPPGRVEQTEGVPVPSGAERHTVRSQPVAPRVDVVGTVASDVRVNLCARVPAYVKEVFVAAGSPVTNGQRLVTLDDRELREQAAAAEAQFGQAEAELARARRLFDNKAATEQSLTAAQAMYASARAQWERSKVMLSYTEVVSPLDGVVTDRRVEPGDLANPGQTLLAVHDPDNLQLLAPVPVRLLPKLPIGQAVEVTVDPAPSPLRGRVRQIVNEADPLSRTQLVKVQIEGATRALVPGTFGRFWVPDDERPAILVPASAVYTAGQVELVQVVRSDRALNRAVRTGARHGASVEVLSGLDAGDVVLVSPDRRN